MKKICDNKGFSLIELIIVVAVMAILIAILAPVFMKYIEKSRKSADLDTVDEVVSAVQTISADPDNADKISENDTITIKNDNSTISSSADLEGALNEIGLRKNRMRLKSKYWGDSGITIKITSDGACTISNAPDSSKGEYNVENEYGK